MKILVKWYTNYADEFDVEGFVIVDEEIWRKFEKYNEQKTEPFIISFGTNEWISYDNGLQLLENISTHTLSEEEAITISLHLGNRYGFCNFFDCFDEDDITL